MDGITGHGNIIRRMSSLLASQEGSKTTSLYHSSAIVLTFEFNRRSNCWVLFYCWHVRSISFSQNSLLRALRESCLLEDHRIPVQVRKLKGEGSENYTESGQWGPPITTTLEPPAWATTSHKRPPLLELHIYRNFETACCKLSSLK